MGKLLSIVIPSHNKTELLIAAIDSILAEDGFDDRCEICISDNSLSEITSAEITLRYSGDNRFVYRRSLDSPSLDENVARAVTLAKGTYVWIFGDDDLIVPGALAPILNFLKKEKHGIVVINSQSFVDFKIIEQGRHFLSEDREYGCSDNDKFISDMGGYLTYVCSVIITRDLWEKNLDPAFIGSVLAHLATILNAKKESTAYFISSPAIKMRLHSQTWTAQHFQIWNINYPKLIWGLKGYSDDAKCRVVKRNPLNSVFSALAARAYGRHNLKTFYSCVLTSQSCPVFLKLIHLGIVFIPRIIFQKLYRIIIILGLKKRSVNFSPELALALLE